MRQHSELSKLNYCTLYISHLLLFFIFVLFFVGFFGVCHQAVILMRQCQEVP